MHQDLLAQALTLSQLDQRRPKQANLRRAVSSAYYAFFHFLASEACRTVLGTGQNAVTYRNVLARAFDHGAMKDACNSFSGGSLPRTVTKGLPPSFRIAPDLRSIAAAFVEAQERRHSADYDRSERFTRDDVIAFVQEVQLAIEKFQRLVDDESRRFFLVSLMVWKTLSKR